jgi:hypothetical protein
LWNVNKLSGRHLGLDGIQEADELLVPMALHTSTDDRFAGPAHDPEAVSQAMRRMVA